MRQWEVQREDDGRPFPTKGKPRRSGVSNGVSDGIRTHDRLDHNQELYRLSYAHRASIWGP
jgi:hypothetical protein